MWRLSPESMRDDLENIFMVLFKFLGNGFRLALCNVSRLATREFVVLMPDPIVFAPWPVLFGRGEPCDSCQDTAHVVVSCFSCAMTCHKSTGRATLASGVDGIACNGFPKLLNVAGVLMMSTLVPCVQRFSIHDLLLVVVFCVSSRGNWQMWEPVDVTRGLVVSDFLLLFIVRVHVLATRNFPFASWCRSTCVTLFPQVRLVYLIFAVPQTQEQIVGCLWSPPRSMRL